MPPTPTDGFADITHAPMHQGSLAANQDQKVHKDRRGKKSPHRDPGEIRRVIALVLGLLQRLLLLRIVIGYYVMECVRNIIY